VTGSYSNTGASNGVANPFQTIQRENVGVTLQVTPQINEGDSVVMDIVQEVSSISQQVLSASDVITNERKIETKVMAQDGDIVVLGGLVKDDIQDSQQGVPVLSGYSYCRKIIQKRRCFCDEVELTRLYPLHDYS
jgi:general secretion pathway protein D